eukprot:CAMPEP_0175120770 /NCGR_PEP_ID=MMETSP0087-20121206/802_1 /TAXON_ID=136419 /ORGANISM="Unknown Unknown, Strain D1" /LENGTH=991 /DNA_ID=CAMNT_0016402247 /DNA_START=43 /DNA_END=3018 /DNA_ORIENTATION=+
MREIARQPQSSCSVLLLLLAFCITVHAAETQSLGSFAEVQYVDDFDVATERPRFQQVNRNRQDESEIEYVDEPPATTSRAREPLVMERSSIIRSTGRNVRFHHAARHEQVTSTPRKVLMQKLEDKIFSTLNSVASKLADRQLAVAQPKTNCFDFFYESQKCTLNGCVADFLENVYPLLYLCQPNCKRMFDEQSCSSFVGCQWSASGQSGLCVRNYKGVDVTPVEKGSAPIGQEGIDQGVYLARSQTYEVAPQQLYEAHTTSSRNSASTNTQAEVFDLVTRAAESLEKQALQEKQELEREEVDTLIYQMHQAEQAKRTAQEARVAAAREEKAVVASRQQNEDQQNNHQKAEGSLNKASADNNIVAARRHSKALQDQHIGKNQDRDSSKKHDHVDPSILAQRLHRNHRKSSRLSSDFQANAASLASSKTKKRNAHSSNSAEDSNVVSLAMNRHSGSNGESDATHSAKNHQQHKAAFAHSDDAILQQVLAKKHKLNEKMKNKNTHAKGTHTSLSDAEILSHRLAGQAKMKNRNDAKVKGKARAKTAVSDEEIMQYMQATAVGNHRLTSKLKNQNQGKFGAHTALSDQEITEHRRVAGKNHKLQSSSDDQTKDSKLLSQDATFSHDSTSSQLLFNNQTATSAPALATAGAAAKPGSGQQVEMQVQGLRKLAVPNTTTAAGARQQGIWEEECHCPTANSIFEDGSKTSSDGRSLVLPPCCLHKATPGSCAPYKTCDACTSLNVCSWNFKANKCVSRTSVQIFGETTSLCPSSWSSSSSSSTAQEGPSDMAYGFPSQVPETLDVRSPPTAFPAVSPSFNTRPTLEPALVSHSPRSSSSSSFSTFSSNSFSSSPSSSSSLLSQPYSNEWSTSQPYSNEWSTSLNQGSRAGDFTFDSNKGWTTDRVDYSYTPPASPEYGYYPYHHYGDHDSSKFGDIGWRPQSDRITPLSWPGWYEGMDRYDPQTNNMPVTDATSSGSIPLSWPGWYDGIDRFDPQTSY